MGKKMRTERKKIKMGGKKKMRKNLLSSKYTRVENKQ